LETSQTNWRNFAMHAMPAGRESFAAYVRLTFPESPAYFGGTPGVNFFFGGGGHWLLFEIFRDLAAGAASI